MTTQITLPKAKMESIFNLALLSSGSKTIHDKAEIFIEDDKLYLNDNQIVHVLTYAKFERDYGFTELSSDGDDQHLVITSTMLDALKSFDCQNVALTENNGKIKITGGKWTYEENSQVPLNKKFDFEIQDNDAGLIPGGTEINYKAQFKTTKEELSKLPQVQSYKFLVNQDKVIVEMEQLGVMTAEIDCSKIHVDIGTVEASLFGAEFQHVLSNFDESDIFVNLSDDFVLFSQIGNEKKIMIGQAMQIQGSIQV